jgi:5-carboxymethyl-2-hydroxymuconate isomerase
MPHIKLEYTGNIKITSDFSKLFTEIHDLLSTEMRVSVENCKSRAIQVDNYLVGDGSKKGAFVHLEVCVLTGKSKQQKNKAGEMLLILLKIFFTNLPGCENLQISVEIKEMPQELYFKTETHKT